MWPSGWNLNLFPDRGSLQKRLMKYILQRFIGSFIKDELDWNRDLEVQLSEGVCELRNLKINEEILEKVTENTPFVVESGSLGKVKVEIAWSKLLTGGCMLEIDGIDIELRLEQSKMGCSEDEEDMVESWYSEAGSIVLKNSSANIADAFLRQETRSGQKNSDKIAERRYVDGNGVEFVSDLVDRIIFGTQVKISNVRISINYGDKEKSKAVVVEIKSIELKEGKTGTESGETSGGEEEVRGGSCRYVKIEEINKILIMKGLRLQLKNGRKVNTLVTVIEKQPVVRIKLRRQLPYAHIERLSGTGRDESGEVVVAMPGEFREFPIKTKKPATEGQRGDDGGGLKILGWAIEIELGVIGVVITPDDLVDILELIGKNKEKKETKKNKKDEFDEEHGMQQLYESGNQIDGAVSLNIHKILVCIIAPGAKKKQWMNELNRVNAWDTSRNYREIKDRLEMHKYIRMEASEISGNLFGEVSVQQLQIVEHDIAQKDEEEVELVKWDWGLSSLQKDTESDKPHILGKISSGKINMSPVQVKMNMKLAERLKSYGRLFEGLRGDEGSEVQENDAQEAIEEGGFSMVVETPLLRAWVTLPTVEEMEHQVFEEWFKMGTSIGGGSSKYQHVIVDLENVEIGRKLGKSSGIRVLGGMIKVKLRVESIRKADHQGIPDSNWRIKEVDVAEIRNREQRMYLDIITSKGHALTHKIKMLQRKPSNINEEDEDDGILRRETIGRKTFEAEIETTREFQRSCQKAAQLKLECFLPLLAVELNEEKNKVVKDVMDVVNLYMNKLNMEQAQQQQKQQQQQQQRQKGESGNKQTLCYMEVAIPEIQVKANADVNIKLVDTLGFGVLGVEEKTYFHLDSKTISVGFGEDGHIKLIESTFEEGSKSERPQLSMDYLVTPQLSMENELMVKVDWTSIKIDEDSRQMIELMKDNYIEASKNGGGDDPKGEDANRSNYTNGGNSNNVSPLVAEVNVRNLSVIVDNKVVGVDGITLNVSNKQYSASVSGVCLLLMSELSGKMRVGEEVDDNDNDNDGNGNDGGSGSGSGSKQVIYNNPEKYWKTKMGCDFVGRIVLTDLQFANDKVLKQSCFLIGVEITSIKVELGMHTLEKMLNSGQNGSFGKNVSKDNNRDSGVSGRPKTREAQTDKDNKESEDIKESISQAISIGMITNTDLNVKKRAKNKEEFEDIEIDDDQVYITAMKDVSTNNDDSNNSYPMKNFILEDFDFSFDDEEDEYSDQDEDSLKTDHSKHAMSRSSIESNYDDELEQDIERDYSISRFPTSFNGRKGRVSRRHNHTASEITIKKNENAHEFEFIENYFDTKSEHVNMENTRKQNIIKVAKALGDDKMVIDKLIELKINIENIQVSIMDEVTKSRIDLQIKKLRTEINQYSDQSAFSFDVSAQINQFEIMDLMPTSTWNKFMTKQHISRHNRKKAHPLLLLQNKKVTILEYPEWFTDSRYIDPLVADMVKFRVEAINGRDGLEYRVDLCIVPIRLFVDQDALMFLNRFIADNVQALSSAQNEDSGNQLKTKKDDRKRHKQEIYFQAFSTSVIDIIVDYKHKSLKTNTVLDVFNLASLEEAYIQLLPVNLRGVDGVGKLVEKMTDTWLPHIQSSSQISNIVGSLVLLKPISNVGGATVDLVLLPIKAYKTNGKWYRAVQSATKQFVKVGIKETVGMGTKLSFVSVGLLEQACELFNVPSPPSQNQQRLSSLSPPTSQHSTSTNTNTPSYLTSGAGKSKSRSKHYSNQPKTAGEGIKLGYKELAKNLSELNSTLKVTMGGAGANKSRGGNRSNTGVGGSGNDHRYSNSSASGGVVKSVPAAVLKPMIGASEAVGKALLGLRNSLDESVKKSELDDKFK